MKHCVVILLIAVWGVLGQTSPGELSLDLLPPFEEVKPAPVTIATIATSELPHFLDPPTTKAPRTRSRFRTRRPTAAPSLSDERLVERQQPREERKSTTPSHITVEPSITTTLKPIEYKTPKPLPPTPTPADPPSRRRTYEVTTTDNFKFRATPTAPVSSPRHRTYEEASPDNFKLSASLPDGSYKFSYNLLESGIQRQEEGSLQKSQLSANSGPNVNGGYTYSAPDGQVISVQYVADEFGFRPVGSHIPEIPDAIKRALKYLQSHAKKDES